MRNEAVDSDDPLLLEERFAGGVPHFTAVTTDPESDPGDQSRLAWAYWGAGQMEQARVHLEAATRVAADHPTVIYVKELIASP